MFGKFKVGGAVTRADETVYRRLGVARKSFHFALIALEVFYRFQNVATPILATDM